MIDFSRRNSFETGNHSRDSECLIIKERKMVSTSLLYDGMQRLAFMLEICHPGSVPDPYLIAAVLDLVEFKFISDILKNFCCKILTKENIL